MPKGLAVLVVFVAAFVVLFGILAVLVGIAPVVPTTEEAFLKLGGEVKGVLLVIVGLVVLAAGVFITWIAGRASANTRLNA